MDSDVLERALIEALERLGVDLRRETRTDSLRTAGGLCQLRGQRLMLLAGDAPVRSRIQALVSALRSLEHESIYLPPAVRDAVG